MKNAQDVFCIKELIKQYKESLGEVNEKLRELERQIAPYRKIYTDKKQTEVARYKARAEAAPFLHKQSIVRSWKSNLEYSITWMETCRMPGALRGIERRAAYEREKAFDPLLAQYIFGSEESIYSWDKVQKESAISETDRTRLNDALSSLTDREKEFYLMAKGDAMSFGQIAELCQVHKATVSTAVYRAEKKIARHLATLKGCDSK